jgi:aspartyl/asparaginyl beta-hydroxylase (cupin superfamily)
MAEIKPPIPAITLEEANTRLAANGADRAALMAKGDHMLRDGDVRAASSFYGAALRVMEVRPDHSAAERQDHTRALDLTQWCADRFTDHLLNSLEEAGFGEGKRPPRFQQSLMMMLGQRHRPPAYEQYPQQPMAHYFPDMPYVSFADPGSFDWVPAIEASFEVMRAEALAALADLRGFVPYSQSDARRPSNNHHGLLDNPDWSSLYLWRDGAAVSENADRCPTILKTITDNAPLCEMGPRAPTILLSLLRPGAHIPPHTGMFNARFICHMPLIVPSDCAFRVGSDGRQWEEGKVLIFDDSVEHEAWNYSDADRLVVIFDVWRPELSADEQRAIKTLFMAVDSFR